METVNVFEVVVTHKAKKQMAEMYRTIMAGTTCCYCGGKIAPGERFGLVNEAIFYVNEREYALRFGVLCETCGGKVNKAVREIMAERGRA